MTRGTEQPAPRWATLNDNYWGGWGVCTGNAIWGVQAGEEDAFWDDVMVADGADRWKPEPRSALWGWRHLSSLRSSPGLPGWKAAVHLKASDSWCASEFTSFEEDADSWGKTKPPIDSPGTSFFTWVLANEAEPWPADVSLGAQFSMAFIALLGTNPRKHRKLSSKSGLASSNLSATKLKLEYIMMWFPLLLSHSLKTILGK